MKITLCCSFGMSTSILVDNMRKYIKTLNQDIIVEAISVEVVINDRYDTDVILLGPQVRFRKNDVISMNGHIPCEIIPMATYGRFDGKVTVDLALNLLK